MTLEIEQKHIQLIDKILAEYDYSFFAFGSRVKGQCKKFSDLDLFYFEEILNIDLLRLEESFEESDLPFKVDIVCFKKCDQDFQAVMLQDYICIKASSRLRMVEQNHLGHFEYFPKSLGFDVSEINGVAVINCGLKTSMFNIAYGVYYISLKNCFLKIASASRAHLSSISLAALAIYFQTQFSKSNSPNIGSIPSDLTNVIDQIKQVYKGQPFAWWIPPSEHNSSLTKALIAQGFVVETVEHAMICDIKDSISFAQKTDLVIKLVTKTSLLQDFISVLEPYDPHVSAFYGRMNETLLNRNEKLVVGYADGKPVSIGILFVSGDSAGIFSLITSKDSQKKGYGTDIMLFSMKLAQDHGCKSVTLSASSDSGYRIYERLGFAKVGEFGCFEYQGGQT